MTRNVKMLWNSLLTGSISLLNYSCVKQWTNKEQKNSDINKKKYQSRAHHIAPKQKFVNRITHQAVFARKKKICSIKHFHEQIMRRKSFKFKWESFAALNIHFQNGIWIPFQLKLVLINAMLCQLCNLYTHKSAHKFDIDDFYILFVVDCNFIRHVGCLGI